MKYIKQEQILYLQVFKFILSAFYYIIITIIVIYYYI